MSFVTIPTTTVNNFHRTTRATIRTSRRRLHRLRAPVRWRIRPPAARRRSAPPAASCVNPAGVDSVGLEGAWLRVGTGVNSGVLVTAGLSTIAWVVGFFVRVDDRVDVAV